MEGDRKSSIIKEARQIKLIALDMDGTLLDSSKTLSAGNRSALERAMEQGIHVVIATGRVLSALPADVVAVPGIEFAITSNGANVVRLKDRRTLYSNLIDRGSVEKIMDLLEDPDIMAEVFFDHDAFAEKRCLDHLEHFHMLTERSKAYTLATRKPVDSIARLVCDHADQLESLNLIFRDMERRSEVWDRLAVLDGMTITSSMPNNIEVGGASASKADGLAHLAELLGVRREQVMACGDSENDMAMLHYAGLSVAMGNAVPGVCAASDVVTKTNDEDGVAWAIERYALARS